MAVHGKKLKIRHKNMADDVTKNGGCHGEQIYIYNQVPTPNKLIQEFKIT